MTDMQSQLAEANRRDEDYEQLREATLRRMGVVEAERDAWRARAETAEAELERITAIV